jgi:outer membrane protein assembly factor BamE (lipoprotein component of BamABCDE complex)
MRILLPLLCLPLFTSCLLSDSRSHASIDADRVAAITPGQTTAQEVLELLGAPNEVVQLGRRSAYRYDHSIEKQAGLFLILVILRGVDTQQDRVWVFLDEAGVVTHAGSTLQAEDAEFSVPGGN